MGFLVGASLAGFGVPLAPPAILMISMIGDVLPSLALILQRPAHRQLDRLAVEGLPALDATLRRDPFVRGIATAVPSLAAYLATLEFGALQANSVAFASLVSAGLFQTLDVARSERYLGRQLLGAVGGSLALLGGMLAVPGIGEVFGLTMPTLRGWGMVGASTASAVVLRQLTVAGFALPTALRGLARRRADKPRQAAGLLPYHGTLPASLSAT